jgi:hypothetical protein
MYGLISVRLIKVHTFIEHVCFALNLYIQSRIAVRSSCFFWLINFAVDLQHQDSAISNVIKIPSSEII